jgi:GNAT superfamily N-acetyltransferase
MPAVLTRRSLPGHGIRRDTGKGFRYAVRVLGTEHVSCVWALQQKVLEPLTPPLPLYVRDEAFFHQCIEGVGCVVGAFHGAKLVAYATLHAPGPREENLGLDLGLPDRELCYVAHLAGSAVDPEYRGNHLQSHLVDVREALAREAGFRHLCGEVVPGNSISIHNHLAVGYYLKAFRIDHLGEPNFVLDKELQRPPRTLLASRLRERATSDVGGFREMVERGNWGFRTTNRPNGTNIVFGRFA